MNDQTPNLHVRVVDTQETTLIVPPEFTTPGCYDVTDPAVGAAVQKLVHMAAHSYQGVNNTAANRAAITSRVNEVFTNLQARGVSFYRGEAKPGNQVVGFVARAHPMRPSEINIVPLLHKSLDLHDTDENEEQEDTEDGNEE